MDWRPHDLLWVRRDRLLPAGSSAALPDWVVAGSGPVVVRRARPPPARSRSVCAVATKASAVPPSPRLRQSNKISTRSASAPNAPGSTIPSAAYTRYW
ncbi:hypothetical protein [Marinobacterium aestuariivivens]|uniref:Phosphoribosyl-dephospho-CoA transferase MdcG N-terminal domain-containing protein n=1 Tax=Marinobacterium aestuariivivens TaxID=1698799 RepID=A0ABW2A274_9GAMM